MQPRESARVPRPQQAFEKTSMFSMAANDPTMQTIGCQRIWRKNSQALTPTKRSVTGAKNFANWRGPRIQNKKNVRLGTNVPPLAPTQFRSIHTPYTDLG